jgi:hypothetical protein
MQVLDIFRPLVSAMKDGYIVLVEMVPGDDAPLQEQEAGEQSHRDRGT